MCISQHLQAFPLIIKPSWRMNESWSTTAATLCRGRWIIGDSSNGGGLFLWPCCFAKFKCFYFCVWMWRAYVVALKNVEHIINVKLEKRKHNECQNRTFVLSNLIELGLTCSSQYYYISFSFYILNTIIYVVHGAYY